MKVHCRSYIYLPSIYMYIFPKLAQTVDLSKQYSILVVQV